MTGFLLWLGAAIALAVGPIQVDRHTILRAETNCRCQCGIIYGQAEDIPAPAFDEIRGHESHWFGDHVGVCFVGPIPDLKARMRGLQLATDMALNQRIYPAHTIPGLIPRNGVH